MVLAQLLPGTRLVLLLCAAHASTARSTAQQRVGGGDLLVGVQAAGAAAEMEVSGGGGGISNNVSGGRYKFELVEIDALSGVAKVHAINGTVSCGKGCHGCSAGTNSANADLIPAESSPTGGAALMFVVRCECPIMIGPNDWLVADGPPKLVVLDVAQLQLIELQTLPPDIFNFDGFTFSASGWDEQTKRAVIVGLHAQNGTSPFSNSTMVFASVDLSSGAIKTTNAVTQCGELEYAVPGCEGDVPTEAVGTMDGDGQFIGLFDHQISAHRLGFPPSLLGTDVASGKQRFNTSFGASFYTMARSLKSADIIGLGICCDESQFPKTCPAKCGASAGPQTGTLALLRWGANRTQPPEILKTFLSDTLGLRFVSAAGGALNDVLDICKF